MKSAADVGSTANRYQILGRIAVGGMAEIYLARAAGVLGVERYCVLKRILGELANDAQFVQMFLDEARLAAQLQHPNIASVYDTGMLGDSYFFTMEYVHGETVRSLVQRAQELRRPLPLACVLTIVAGTAAGLHHAHERNGNDGRPLGIVHRDISPSNVMVSYEGNVKVVDFGVAKADDRVAKTQAGTVKGKISYLSPEQCRGVRVDRRSDLFSLGIVMWEMLTGARLYRRSNDFKSMTAIVREPPPPPSSRRSDVPRAIDDIVLRLLAKSVTDRFQTAHEVIEAVENASLHARTILSTSAVSQLVRDLFGARPEPWLECEGETLPLQPSMLAPRPLAEEPGRTLLDPVDVDHAVPELALSDMFDDVLTDGSLPAIDALTPGLDACPPAVVTTVPGSRAARSNAPHDVPRSPLPGVPIIAPSPGPSPAGVAPVAALGSQPVHIADLVARAAAPAAAGPAKLLAAISAPSRSPNAMPPAVTLRGVPPGGGADMAATGLPATAATASTAMAAGLVLTAGPPVTALDRSPMGTAATAPLDPPAAGPSAVTLRDAFMPTLIAPPIASTLAPTLIASASPARATPPAPYKALPTAAPAPAPSPVALPRQHARPASSPAAAPPRPAPPPISPVPHPAQHAALSPVLRPPPGRSVPAPSASGITTAKWRPTKELARRVAPHLFTVLIPAATVGAILAWLLTHDEPHAPKTRADPAPAAVETSPPPAIEAPPAGAPGEEKAEASGVAPGTDSPAPAPASPPHPPGESKPGAGESTPPSTPDTEPDRRRPPYGKPESRTSDHSSSKPNASAHTATKPPMANSDPYAQIKLMHEQRNYPAVVSACHAFVARPDIAYACFDAACHQQNREEARRWLALIPGKSQSALVAACKQLGTSV